MGQVDQTISVAILHCIIRCLSPLYVTLLSHFSWNFIVFCLFCTISFLKVQTNLCFRERLPSQDFLQRHLSLFTLFTLCLHPIMLLLSFQLFCLRTKIKLHCGGTLADNKSSQLPPNSNHSILRRIQLSKSNSLPV